MLDVKQKHRPTSDLEWLLTRLSTIRDLDPDVAVYLESLQNLAELQSSDISRIRNLRELYETQSEATQVSEPEQSTIATSPKFASRKKRDWFESWFAPIAKALVWLAVIAVALWKIDGWLDSNGYLPHNVQASISARQDWIIGESKFCSSTPLNDSMAGVWNEKIGYVAAPITCDGGPYRTVRIKLYGRTEQPERTSISWRCTRETDSFTCRQVGAE